LRLEWAGISIFVTNGAINPGTYLSANGGVPSQVWGLPRPGLTQRWHVPLVSSKGLGLQK